MVRTSSIFGLFVFVGLLIGGTPVSVQAQTGPGGVGNAGGNGEEQPQNVLWLRADQGVTTSGGAVTTWTDQSGNGNDATQSSGDPVLLNNAFGGKPAVEFVASDQDVFDFNDGNPSFQLTDLGTGNNTILIVSKRIGGEDNQFTLNFDNSTCVSLFGTCIAGGLDLRSIGYNVRIGGTGSDGGTLNLASVSGTSAEITQSVTTANPSILTSIVNNASSSPTQDLGANNEVFDSGGVSTLGGSASTVLLGALSSDSREFLEGGYLSGKVAEVIAYDGALNAAQLRILYNHLSEKYGIQIANDFYAYAGNGVDVAGLGQADSSFGEAPQGSHTVARSAELQLSTTAASLNGGEYVHFGHDGASTAFSQVERPNGKTTAQKINREWRVDLEGSSSHSVTASIDANDLPSLSGDLNDYALFVDADGDFSEGATFYDMDNTSGSRYAATGVSLSDGDYVAIAAIERTITFATESKTDFENTGTPEPALPLELNYPNQSGLSLGYSVSSGTNSPTNDSDYETCCEPSQSTTFTIPAGQTTFDLNTAASDPPPFRILDEGDQESNTEFVDVAVDPSSNGSVAGGEATTLEFGIVDDDFGRTASVSTSASSVTESSADTVTATVTLSSPASGSDVTVAYELSGAATAGTDYENLEAGTPDTTKGSVTIPDGQSTTSFDLKVLDDNTFEPDEDVVVTLVSAEGGATLAEDNGSLPSAAVTITDDESPPTVAFSAESFTGTEGTPVNATVQLSAAAGTDVNVQFSVSNGSAGTGDYDKDTSSPVTIPASQTQASIEFDLTSDDEPEPTETFTVTLDGTQNGNATVGTPQSADVNITDTDGVGETGPGGVGDSQSLKVWLSADALSLSDGNEVTTWPDRSGNGNDASVSSGNGPDFQSSVAAFGDEPAVRFTSGNSDYLDLSGITDLGNGANTVFAVSATNTNGQQGLLTVANVDPLNGNVAVQRSLRYNSGPSVDALNGSGIASTSSVTSDGTPAILESVFDGDTVDVATNREAPDTSTSVGLGSGTSAVLGAGIELSGGTESRLNHLSGDVAELVVFNQALNASQRTIVANYLAAKYGLSLTNDDLYAGDEGPGYDQDVLGVGQSDGNAHLRAKAGGVEATVRSGLADGEFLFLGAPSDSSSDVNVKDATTANGAGLTARADQNRYVDLEGQFKVDLQFDLDAFGLQGPAGKATHYKLLRRAGASGNWTVASATPSVSGGKITFSNVALPTNYEGRLTIGTTNQAASPLDTRLTAVRGSPGADQSDKGWRFYGPPKTGPVQMQEIRLRTPNGKRQAVSFEVNMSYVWDSGGDPNGNGTYGEWVSASPTTPVPPGRGSLLFLYDDQYFPINPELTIDPKESGNNGTYSYTGDTNVTVGDGSPSGDETLRSDVTYHLLANPYEVPYDLGALQTLGVDADNDGTDDWSSTVQVWDPTDPTPGGDPRGSYELRSTDPAKPKSERLISPGQAFWVERADTNGGGATQLVFQSTGRQSSTLTDFVGSAKSTAASGTDAGQIKLRLQVHDGNGDLVARDRAASLYFRSGARTGWDAFDAKKQTPLDESYATIAFRGTGKGGNSILKAQDSRPYGLEEPVENEMALTTQGVSGEATLSAPEWWSIPPGWTLTLVDRQEDVEHTLGRDGNQPYTFTIDGSEQEGTSSPTPSSSAGAGTTKKIADAPSPRQPQPLHETVSSSPRSKASAESDSRFVLRLDPREDEIPVELTDLSARLDGQDVLLEWATASETNNAGFAVEHQRLASTDSTASPRANAWSRLGFVEGEGTTSEPQTYQHRVRDLDYGRHVFRLRQVDTDGSETRSEVVEAEIRLEEGHVVDKPYPNPVRQQAQLEVAVRESQPVRIELYDVLGRHIRTIHDQELSDHRTHRVRIETRGLSSGLYFVQVEGTNFTETRRLTVVR